MSRMLERSTSCNFTIDCGEGHDTADCETCVVVAAVERFSPVTLPRNEQVGVWGAPVQGCSVAVFKLVCSFDPTLVLASPECFFCLFKATEVFQSLWHEIDRNKFLQFVLIG